MLTHFSCLMDLLTARGRVWTFQTLMHSSEHSLSNFTEVTKSFYCA